MILHVDRDRLAAAHRIAHSQLLAERNSQGHWVGELSSSPLSTATAISALFLAEQGGTSGGLPTFTPGIEPSHVEDIYRSDLSEMIVHSMHWLAEQQNEDGGWGDTDRSRSNIATTMLVQAAFHLTGVPAKYADLLERAEQYVEQQGGLAALKRRYEGDKTFAVPILANCALADMISWRKVPSLPFELACLPQHWYHKLNLPVVSYAIPALVAIGQAKHFHSPPRNPLTKWMRNAARKKSLEVLEAMQPASGGFLEATPLTSFVVMSLASMGLVDHVVVRRGVEFLLASVRTDGSWPIDTNLATWNTSLALKAIEGDVDDESAGLDESQTEPVSQTIDWLLNCQHRAKHPFTGANPGGWGWTDLPGAVPDADDTSAALLALAAWEKKWPSGREAEVKRAAISGVQWLLELQNKDGGWPTFCRGWGRLPFDRSSNDITAHALRALHVWQSILRLKTTNASYARRVSSARHAGIQYLERQQKPDGSWLPLWFGNQANADESNPIYGSAKVLLAYQELDLADSPAATKAAEWLCDVQLASGGWGAVQTGNENQPAGEQEILASVEETSLAVEALLPFSDANQRVATSVEQGISWLIEAVEANQHTEPAPIGFYFAKLWYYERLYPQIFATRALSRACKAAQAVPAVMGAAR